MAETTISGGHEDKSWRIDTTDRAMVRRLVTAGWTPLSSSGKIYYIFRIPKRALSLRTLRQIMETKP